MYPDFIGIGAQKSGTSWLHTNLEKHPQIWLPPMKELHYLDQGPAPLAKRLFGDSKRMKRGRKYLIDTIRALPRGGRLSDVSWALRYSLAPRNDAWYGSLFPEEPGKIAGEVCPGYARIRGEAVGRIRRLMPNVKVIYFLRNPLERPWSYARQHFKLRGPNDGYGTLDKVPLAEMQAFLKRDREGHSDLYGAVAAWERYFGPEQMFIGFFDDLAKDPRAMLKRVLDFLGVDSSEAVIPATVQRSPNPGRPPQMPPEIRAYLAGLHHEQLIKLHARFDNACTAAWLASAEAALADGAPSLTGATADR
jgi:hypothetical protein